MAAPNPLERYSEPGAPTVSSQIFAIAGIETIVYGLEELPKNPADCNEVACLWLLHPRLQAKEIMTPIAAAHITDWNNRTKDQKSKKGLIAVSFDQRNHGSREINALANESWKKGNDRHALDMFAIFHGTAEDTSLLIDLLPSYIFPWSERSVVQHLALGISLGGHSTWNRLLSEPRITAGVVIVGCPDYRFIMSDRARKSKLETASKADGKDGSQFFGSCHFPKGLGILIDKYDPVGRLVPGKTVSKKDEPIPEPSEEEKRRLRPLLKNTLGGKRIMCLSGGKDKLVPYFCSAPFLDWLKLGLDKDKGWINDQGIVLEDIVDNEAGHEYTLKMRAEAVRFISETLAGEGGLKVGSKTSKI